MGSTRFKCPRHDEHTKELHTGLVVAWVTRVFHQGRRDNYVTGATRYVAERTSPLPHGSFAPTMTFSQVVVKTILQGTVEGGRKQGRQKKNRAEH